MSNYEKLLQDTKAEREAFLDIPIIRQALEKGVDRSLYLAYLCEAYHHVKHTCPLLAFAAARCQEEDARLREAFFDYIAEERGHDEWILQDIEALGGDAEAVRRSHGGAAARIMTGYAYYAIERSGPCALLGMVHVLEGISAAIATRAAESIRAGLNETGDAGGGGFSYLESHGSLDQGHVKFFEELVNGIGSAETLESIIDTARIMYRLFGDVFRDLAAQARSSRNAA